MRARLGGLIFPLAVMWLAGCATPTHEPRNLESLKGELRAYLSSGDYDREISSVAARAEAWVSERVAQRRAGEKLTMIFDLDETLLSNRQFLRDQDFGGNDAAWNAWMGSGADPANESVRELFRAVRRLGVDVVFLTGRRERIRAGTEKNLRDLGCVDYVALLCRPNDDQGSVAIFKTAQRKGLAEEGRAIIANIGDQASDLAGGFAERTFKLPNPFYILP